MVRWASVLRESAHPKNTDAARARLLTGFAAAVTGEADVTADAADSGAD